MSDFFGSFLTPPPLLIRFLPSIIRFFGVILDPPLKIGHHLCTLPLRVNGFIWDLLVFLILGFAYNICKQFFQIGSKCILKTVDKIPLFCCSIQSKTKNVILNCTDYGYPEGELFSKIPNLWACADKLDRKFLVHLRYLYSVNLSAPILVLQVPSPCNQPLFLQKTKPLYPNIYLGIGFEFGPQRIGDLVIVCP